MNIDSAFDTDDAAGLLSLMAHEGRLRVFELITRNEWDVTSLAAAVNLSQSALSQHLKKLRDAKVVDVRRDAQTLYYSCKSEAVAKILLTLSEIYGGATALKSAA
ncbi:MAG: metalloregulator ArsR/SmtB family transcription factor [Neorhizobium sp.]|jgi:DNA-binding transcriptional ArsR family regulator|nr:metalloregulator ArsR/SmtB family transcription factor [Neorhizobium sp.]